MRLAARILAGAMLLLLPACSDPGEEMMVPPEDDGGTGGEPALPETLVVVADRDNTLYEHDSGVLSNGAGAHVFVGRPAGLGPIRRALLHFDVSSHGRHGTEVTEAWLDLVCSRTREFTDTDVSLHRVLASWGEGASNAIKEEGQGAVAEPGDATWIHREYDTVNWAVAGGDFEAAASGTLPVGGLGPYRWPSGEGLVADVQAWLDDPASNHGWILLGDESMIETARRFDSREHDVAANRPTLTVVFAADSAAGF